MAGTAISAACDGVALANVTDGSYTSGYAVLGSGYHAAAWGALVLQEAA